MTRPGDGPESADDVARSVAALSGGGLPAEAQARLEQLRRTSSWTSALSVDAFAAVRSVGFEPVGQVMGSTVDQIGWTGWGDCGAALGARGYASTGNYGGYRIYGGTVSTLAYGNQVRALYAARRRAMNRLEQECTAVGGDGVIGVQITRGPFPGVTHAYEFQAIGTAVRARGKRHPPKPFSSDLSGQDFAKLLQAGWVPCGLVYGISIGVRHDDYRQARQRLVNQELTGYTDLVHEVRKDVRRELESDVARKGGTACVMQDMTLRIWEKECARYEGAGDHAAEASILGTAVVPFEHTAKSRPGTLQILRLDQRHGATISKHLTDHEAEFS